MTFRGFVSAESWETFDLSFSLPPNNNLHTAATKAMMILIRALHNYTLQLWAGQNEVLHVNDSETSTFVHSALNYHITQLFTLQSSFSPISIQSNFTIPLEGQLHRSPRQRKRWLYLARLATCHASALDISTYFTHAPKASVQAVLQSPSTVIRAGTFVPKEPVLPCYRHQLPFKTCSPGPRLTTGEFCRRIAPSYCLFALCTCSSLNILCCCDVLIWCA